MPCFFYLGSPKFVKFMFLFFFVLCLSFHCYSHCKKIVQFYSIFLISLNTPNILPKWFGRWGKR